MDTRAIDQVIGRVLRVFAFFIPFHLLGVVVGNYVFSISTFCLVFLNLLLLIRGHSFVKGTISWFYIFISWCLFVTYLRYPFSSYGMSFLALGAMLFPLCTRIPKSIERKSVLKALIYGAAASFVVASYEVGVNFGLPALTEVTSLGLWGTSVPQESTYFGIYRVKAGESEPAHYAHYLTFVYATVDLADRYGYEIRRPRLLKSVLAIFLFATISLSGLILFVSYLSSVLVWEWRSRVLQKVTSEWFWVSIPLVFALALGVYQYMGEEISGYLSFMFGRIEDAWAAIQLGLISGSEASRARSATVVFEYWASQDWLHILAGEGYANYENWLKQTFGGMGGKLGSSFERGNVQNVFSAVGISTGVIGVISYLLFARSIFSRLSKIAVPLIVIWLVSHFAMGTLIGYRLWWPLLIGVTLFERYTVKDKGGI